MSQPQILIVELGSQYTKLIGRRLRELGHRSVILDPMRAEKWLVHQDGIRCVIYSGGPHSVSDSEAPKPTQALLQMAQEAKLPMLGICFGMQWLADELGGRVERHSGEYGDAESSLDLASPLFAAIAKGGDRGVTVQKVWASHGDTVAELPPGFNAIGRQAGSGSIAAMASHDGLVYGVQFHPEVSHTPCGLQILENFVHGIAGCSADWVPEDMIEDIRASLTAEGAGTKRAIMGFSGGVDSTTLARIASPIYGDRLLAIVIDGGHLRKDEMSEIRQHADRAGVKFRVVNAKAEFLARLAGITDAEKKRAAFKEVYASIFDREAHEFSAERFLQGTLAPDVIESGADGRDLIKSHHNVGIKVAGCESLHPLSSLFKDEVRELAKVLRLPESVWGRQPFPGPGLFLRVVGTAVTEDALRVVREADAIVTGILKRHGEYGKLSQLVVALAGLRTVGVKGDARIYNMSILVRGVVTYDFMTAEGYVFPAKAMKEISREITKLSQGPISVVRVWWDATDKPSGTTEFE